jgi:uncharacterized protein involved in response to NO
MSWKQFISVIGSFIILVGSILIPFTNNIAYIFLLFGILVLIGALITFREDMRKIGSIILLVFAVLAMIFLMVNGSNPDTAPYVINSVPYIFFGSLISIIGGVVDYFQVHKHAREP